MGRKRKLLPHERKKLLSKAETSKRLSEKKRLSKPRAGSIDRVYEGYVTTTQFWHKYKTASLIKRYKKISKFQCYINYVVYRKEAIKIRFFVRRGDGFFIPYYLESDMVEHMKPYFEDLRLYVNRKQIRQIWRLKHDAINKAIAKAESGGLVLKKMKRGALYYDLMGIIEIFQPKSVMREVLSAYERDYQAWEAESFFEGSRLSEKVCKLTLFNEVET